ncbi:phospholipase A2-like [Contarinia nasturtii]|uniref:phospholipase A2-like n=1 Tax=Contarinia nasturtii TaxID=265458 RepID=UPI0012D3CDF4|nr:phospholipase A2-like [Contarinia nasturtii]XP_031635154.1 phospholipase A2-like [Contarinia nasturtii]
MHRDVILVVVVVVFCAGASSTNISKYEQLPSEIWHRFEKSLQNNYDSDVLNAIHALNMTIQKFHEFQRRSEYVESRDAMINSRIGVFLFTRYCGPGARIFNRIFKTDERTYTNIDNCCRMHDECPEYVLQPHDYQQYPGLDVRPQFFSRLKCSCDAEFYQCLENIETTYALTIGIGYGIFQRYCFEYEHPIMRCSEYYIGFGLRRCMAYEINYSAPKKWQWFDVLPPYLEIYNFPQFIQSAISLN